MNQFIQQVQESNREAKEFSTTQLVPALKELGLELELVENGVRVHMGVYKNTNLSLYIDCSKILTGLRIVTYLVQEPDGCAIYYQDLGYEDNNQFDTLEEVIDEVKRISNLIKSKSVKRKHQEKIKSEPQGLGDHPWAVELVKAKSMKICWLCNGKGCYTCKQVGALPN